MGGYGSGRHSAFPSVGGSLRIEMPQLKARQYLSGAGAIGSWSWSCGGAPSGSIGLRTELKGPEGGRLILTYNHKDVPKQQDIALEAVPMRFGGVRWYARCPSSGRRCGTLVFASWRGGFVSVKAAGIPYTSQTEGKLDRLRRRRDKLETQYQALSKYTRRHTRMALWDDFCRADERYEMAFEVMAGRLCERIAKFDLLHSRRAK